MSPIGLALVISILIILLLPDFFNKYTVEVLKKGSMKLTNQVIEHYDLDQDGHSEKIYSFLAPQEFHCLQLFDYAGGIIDQWNLDGTIAGNMDRLVADDYDHDGTMEVFAFCQSGDSVVLYGFKPIEKSPFFIKHRLITRLTRKYADPEYAITSLNLVDVNNDSYKDLVFVISSGFSLQPRQIFIYDIRMDSLISSKPAGSVIGKLKFADLTGDGFPEIMGNSGASGNVNDSLDIPFSDYNAWLMVYDRHLKFLFKPVKFPGFHSFMKTYPIRFRDTCRILTLFNHTGSMDNYPLLSLRDHHGTVILERKFGNSPKYQIEIMTDRNGIWMIQENGLIRKLNPDLTDQDSILISAEIRIDPLFLDLDGDTKNEIIILKKDIPEGIIFREGFKDPIEFNLPERDAGQNNQSFALIETDGKVNTLFIQQGKKYTTYKYGFNSLYYLKYPIFLGIYLAIFLFVLLIRKIQRIQIQEKISLKKEITAMQLKTINNQLDPHFTLNAFNAIAGLLKREEGNTAYAHFIKFSNLVRANLISADQITRTLDEELKTVRNYLDIQKLRFKDRFDYVISIDPKVDPSVIIPKMTIQNYVENAVKHGLRHLTLNGMLSIDILPEEKHLKIIIQDNGIGREKAKDFKGESTGMGLKLMEHYFQLLNQYNSIKIIQEIIDLYDNNNAPSGTRVTIKIPVNFKYGGI